MIRDPGGHSDATVARSSKALKADFTAVIAARSLRIGFIAILLFGVSAPYPALARHKPSVLRAGIQSSHRETFDSAARPSGLGSAPACTETDTNVGAIFVGPGCGSRSDVQSPTRYH